MKDRIDQLGVRGLKLALDCIADGDTLEQAMEKAEKLEWDSSEYLRKEQERIMGTVNHR